MLNASKVLELAQSGDTATIVAMAKKEIIEAAAKASGGNTLLKRTRAAAKYIDKCDECRRGAWIDDKGDQLFTNGYTALTLQLMACQKHQQGHVLIFASVSQILTTILQWKSTRQMLPQN
mgnify:CR=1 FL=1